MYTKDDARFKRIPKDQCRVYRRRLNKLCIHVEALSYKPNDHETICQLTGISSWYDKFKNKLNHLFPDLEIYEVEPNRYRKIKFNLQSVTPFQIIHTIHSQFIEWDKNPNIDGQYKTENSVFIKAIRNWCVENEYPLDALESDPDFRSAKNIVYDILQKKEMSPESISNAEEEYLVANKQRVSDYIKQYYHSKFADLKKQLRANLMSEDKIRDLLGCKGIGLIKDIMNSFEKKYRKGFRLERIKDAKNPSRINYGLREKK